MKHFFEVLERRIDFSNEYLKLEQMISVESHHIAYEGCYSINDWIDKNFREWDKRGSYISLAEVRSQLGFSYKITNNRFEFRKDVGMQEYFLFCELFINITHDLSNILHRAKLSQYVSYIESTISIVVENSGFEIVASENGYIILEKNAVAFLAAEYQPDISSEIVEYNHYLLRGNIDRKCDILRKIADALEPRRSELISMDEGATQDFFFLVNKMNVRHNNCDPSDPAHYVKAFESLPDSEKEKWYDAIYDQALYLFILPNHIDRKNKIREFKKAL